MIPRFVTSDSHFGHANILEYAPWRQTWAKTIEEHDAKLVESWNLAVGEKDLVLHCGDFSLGPVDQTFEHRRKLKGRIALVRGNHDRSPKRMRELGIDDCESRYRFDVPGYGRVLAIHDPAGLQDEDCSDVLCILHGHWHGEVHRRDLRLRADILGKLIDVGIDARQSRRPARLTDVLDQFLKRQG